MQIVLITYMNRSGSTFLANLLSSSKDICVCPEGDAVVELFLEAPGQKLSYNSGNWPDLKKSMDRDGKMAVWDIREDAISYLEKSGTRLEAFRNILKYYRDRNKPDALAVVFKAERIGALMRKIMLADSENPGEAIKFISLVRDPRAVVASQMATCNPGSNVPMGKNPVWTAIRWKISQEQILESGSGSTLQMILKYEDLISRPEETIGKISGFLNIGLSGISPAKGDLLSRLPGEVRYIHPLTDKAPQTGRIDGWRSQLTAKNLYLVEKTCGIFMKRFGYEKFSRRISPYIALTVFIQALLFYTRRLYLKMRHHFSPRNNVAAF